MTPARLALLALLAAQLAACQSFPGASSRAGLDRRVRAPVAYTSVRPAQNYLFLGVQ